MTPLELAEKIKNSFPTSNGVNNDKCRRREKGEILP